VTLNPKTAREMQIVRSLGATGWIVVSLRAPVCLKGAQGALITKSNHQRWVKVTQITP
jgi:hypothetical protein